MSTFDNDLEEFGFDASTVEPTSSFDVIPAGEYNAICSKTEVKKTKDEKGKFISATFQIFDGEFDGRLVFQNITLSNPSDKATEIGKRELSSFCRAINVITPKDTSDLLEKPLVIKVGIEPAKNGYEAKNNVKEFKAYGESSDKPSAPSAKPSSKPSAPAEAKKPWSK